MRREIKSYGLDFKITLPSGSTYDLKDAWARSQISALVGGDAIVFKGVSSTALTDGGTQKPTVDGSQVNPTVGQLYFYGTQEFVWGSDSKWHELGSLDNLGDLAYEDTASGKFTPAGTVSQPTFQGILTRVILQQNTVEQGKSVQPGAFIYQPAGTISGELLLVLIPLLMVSLRLLVMLLQQPQPHQIKQ